MAHTAGTIVGLVLPFLIILIFLLSRSIKRVPPDHARNVVRLGGPGPQRILDQEWDISGPNWAGRFHRTLGPGLHMVIPGLDEVSAPIDLREQVVLLTDQPVIIADNQPVTVDTLVSFQVTNPRAAIDKCGDQKLAVERLVSYMLLDFIGHSDLEQVLASRDKFSAQLRDRLDSLSDEWGIRVSFVEIRSIVPEPMVNGTGQPGPLPSGPGSRPSGQPDSH
jgi:regulator of protease activity HflC (stomatin/prohibitin superfamily)